MTLKKLLKKIQSKEQSHKKFYYALLILLGIVLFLPVFFQIRYQELRSLGLIGVFFLNLIGSATIFLPTPAFLSVGVSATQMSPILVAIIASLGAAIGEGTTFLFGLSSRKVLDLEKHKGLKKFKEKVFDRWGTFVIIILAFFPNPFFDGLGMLAGISKYPWKKFLILTFFGRLLRNLFIGYVAIFLASG